MQHNSLMSFLSFTYIIAIDCIDSYISWFVSCYSESVICVCCIVISNYSYSFARKYFSNTQKIMLKTELTLKTWTIY